jgi:molybdopterin converting factor small subunit
VATESSPRTLTVRVLTFARLREALGFGERAIELPPGATLEDAWANVTAGWSEAAAMRPSTRFARNGTIVDAATALADGDEIALLPPVGGG